MQSRNKPTQTADEAAYVAIVATLQCAVCGATPVEVHEFEQGNWWTAVPLCADDHRGKDGWHGTRQRWKLRKVTMLDTIGQTVGVVFRIVTERSPLRVSTRRAVQTQGKPTKLGRPEKIVPRRIAP